MDCMRPVLKYMIRWAALLGVLFLLSACAKDENAYPVYADDSPVYGNPKNGTRTDLAIGTVLSRDGVRFIRLDEKSCGQVMNPKEIADIQDGTRVFLQYRFVVVSALADFCTDAILVEWVSPIDMGAVVSSGIYSSSSPSSEAGPGDPVGIVLDWMTSLEDGFLTIHYSIPSSGNTQHTFVLVETETPLAFRFVHDAHGDTRGSLTEGIVCFEVSALLPETGDEPVTMSLDYIDLNNTEKRLTVEYRSPK